MTDPRRAVPRTDAVLADARLVDATRRVGREQVKRAVVASLQAVRDGVVTPADVVADALIRLNSAGGSMRPVINATGVVLHTNLGRAPLSAAAIEAMTLAAGYTDVEFDLASGERARRGRGALAALRRAVPDAEDVLVVNNGAAALVLATTALAAGREVIVSRGEMVEIGDGFRLPDLIASTGARLREVGTTNRVHLDDYASAVGSGTGCILKVHPSNFRVEGFTSSVGVSELATLGVPVVADIGSGLLAADAVLPDEPDAASTLRAGASVVTCSADKLLGGPQGGLLLGSSELIALLRKHPLARAVRVDKLTLAALEASLDRTPTPTWTALHADAGELRERCAAIVEALAGSVAADLVACAGAVGGGGAPGLELAGWAVAVPASLVGALRTGTPAVVGRVEHGQCLLDLRCVPASEDHLVQQAILAAAAG